MGAARAEAGGRGALRPCQRRTLSTRHRLVALAPGQSAASVHDGADPAGRFERCADAYPSTSADDALSALSRSLTLPPASRRSVVSGAPPASRRSALAF